MVGHRDVHRIDVLVLLLQQLAPVLIDADLREALLERARTGRGRRRRRPPARTPDAWRTTSGRTSAWPDAPMLAWRSIGPAARGRMAGTGDGRGGGDGLKEAPARTGCARHAGKDRQFGPICNVRPIEAARRRDGHGGCLTREGIARRGPTVIPCVQGAGLIDANTERRTFRVNVSEPVAMAAWYVEHLGMRIVRQNRGAAYPFPGGCEWLRRHRDLQQRGGLRFRTMPRCTRCGFISRSRPRIRTPQGPRCEKPAQRSSRREGPDGSRLLMLRDPWGFPLQLCKRATPLMPVTVSWNRFVLPRRDGSCRAVHAGLRRATAEVNRCLPASRKKTGRVADKLACDRRNLLMMSRHAR